MLKWVGKAYEVLWQRTTGEPFTYIMRRNPKRAGPFLAFMTFLFFLLAMATTFIAGHVFWGKSITSLMP